MVIDTAAPESASSPSGWRAVGTGPYAGAVATLAAGVATHAINVYLATSVLPSAVGEIGGLELYAWVTTAFLLASVLGALYCGTLHQRHGPRAVHMAAAAVFAAGTLTCALAPSMVVLLAGRVVQGLGGGVLLGGSYALVRVVIPEPLWPRAMALLSAMWGIGTLVGPAMGGAASDLGAWRVGFALMLLVALALLLASHRHLPAARRVGAHADPAPDPRGIALVCASVGLVSVASLAERAPVAVAGVVAALVALVAWAAIERNSARPLLPRVALGRGPRRNVYLLIALLAAISAVEAFVPYFGQQINGLGPLAAAYLGAAIAAGWTAGSVRAAGSTRGVVFLARTGATIVTVALAALVVLTAKATGAAGLALTAVALTALGVGIGIAWPHLLTEVLRDVPSEDADRAAGSISTVQLTCTALGAGVAGLVVNLAGLTDPGGTDGAALALYTALIAPAAVGILIATRAGACRV